MYNIARKQKGMTLIELMIVVAIIGILTAVAYPVYQDQALKTRRSEGTSEMTRIMDMQERLYTNRFPPLYTDNLANLGLSAPYQTDGGTGFYRITAAGCGAGLAECVLLTATPLRGQVDDGVLTLNSLGQKTRDGNPGWE